MSPEVEQAIRERIRSIPCVSALGLEVVELREGDIAITAQHDERFNGIFPYFHGGMLANVADCAAWFAIVSKIGPQVPMVTTDMALRYLAPCEGTVTASAHVIKFGKTLCPVQVDLHDREGVHVVTGQVCYLRLDGR